MEFSPGERRRTWPRSANLLRSSKHDPIRAPGSILRQGRARSPRGHGPTQTRQRLRKRKHLARVYGCIHDLLVHGRVAGILTRTDKTGRHLQEQVPHPPMSSPTSTARPTVAPRNGPVLFGCYPDTKLTSARPAATATLMVSLRAQ
jgi:hypothetical protein